MLKDWLPLNILQVQGSDHVCLKTKQQLCVLQERVPRRLLDSSLHNDDGISDHLLRVLVPT